ncbi:MAG: amino acid adenylation domain-containing protein [Deltaproteobacteria bacterium]|nr:amino acid adenylation domain-containing protein [Deltaproteobacteria bacterium]TLN00931.1 MAG: amino acid adenylation domain-containing protein [bacterium]
MDGYLVQHYLDPLPAPPEKVACTDGRKAITYGYLADFSSRLATILSQVGVRRKDRVALCLHRTPDFLPAILGILKADAAYVPLDPKSPPERWQQIVGDCAPAAILCDGQTFVPLAGAVKAGIPRILLTSRSTQSSSDNEISAALEDILASPVMPVTYHNGPDDLAYVLYTSGSTGQPKGVMITHRNICNYINWAVEYFSILNDDRILGTAPFHFDMSTFDLWCPVKAGATLCLANEALTLFPEKLLGFMESERVTIWKGISSLLFYLERAGVITPARIPALSRVLFGGDALPARTLIRWMETFSDKLFYNVYGPTEATGVSLCCQIKQAPGGPGERIPIGHPCKGMKAALLDKELKPVPDGAVGELCLSGPGLGAGYLNDPERTARSFICAKLDGGQVDTWYRTGDLALRRPDGNYVFIGREDNQVKIMGYRIEMGEIEQALLAIDGVRDAAVVAVQRGGLDELVAFVEVEEVKDYTQILARLRDRIPAYMIPRRLIPLVELPRCGRGKINRAALRTLSMEVRHADG